MYCTVLKSAKKHVDLSYFGLQLFCQLSKKPGKENNQIIKVHQFQKSPTVQDAHKMASPMGSDEKCGYDIFLKMAQHTEALCLREAMNRTVLGLFLMNCMEATGYLKDPAQSERVFFARLALEFYNVILSNNHSISFLIPSQHQDVELKK